MKQPGKNKKDRKAEGEFIMAHERNLENVARKEKKIVKSTTMYFDGLALLNSMANDRVGDRKSWTKWFRDYADPFTLADFENSVNLISTLHHARLNCIETKGLDPASGCVLLFILSILASLSLSLSQRPSVSTATGAKPTRRPRGPDRNPL